jgi:hypothetical protein
MRSLPRFFLSVIGVPVEYDKLGNGLKVALSPEATAPKTPMPVCRGSACASRRCPGLFRIARI